MGRPMLSKPLIRFSVDGQGCSQTMVGVVAMVSSFKRTYGALLWSVPPAPPQATVDRRRQRRPDTHRRVWLTLLWGPGSFLLVLACTRFGCALRESVSPDLRRLCNQIPKLNSLGFLSSFAGFPGWEICCGP